MLGSCFFFFFMVFLFWLHAVAVLRPLCLRKGLKHWDVDRQQFFFFLLLYQFLLHSTQVAPGEGEGNNLQGQVAVKASVLFSVCGRESSSSGFPAVTVCCPRGGKLPRRRLVILRTG